jgi:CRISPR-associated protein Cas2
MARRRRREIPNGWSMMWIFCMFDLPVRTKKEMRMATRFRNTLLDHGFAMKQYSIYIKCCSSLDAAKTQCKHLKAVIPANGSVTFLYVTDKQYLMTDNFLGKSETENEEEERRKNGQLLLI